MKQIVRQPKNHYTYTNSTDGSATEISSDVIHIKYKNDSGSEQPISNLEQDFDIFIGKFGLFTHSVSIQIGNAC